MSRPGASWAVQVAAVVRAAPLAGSMVWQQLTGDPARAALSAHRLTPRRVRSGAHTVILRVGGTLSRALVRWDETQEITLEDIRDGDPPSALRRMASLALAVDRPDVAAAAVRRLPAADPARRLLLADIAHREGRLGDARTLLAGPAPPGIDQPVSDVGKPSTPTPSVILRKRAVALPRFRKITGAGGPGSRGTGRTEALRRRVEGELTALDPARPWAAPRTGRIGAAPGRVLHLVTNALPYKSAGYTIRTQRIAGAQRDAGLDPHVVTRAGFPVAQGVPDGRRYAEVGGVPYHRLLPRSLPPAADAALAQNLELATGLVERLRPAVLHPASDHRNGQLALALRDRFAIPVVYEVRGFLEESWLAGDRDPDCDHYRLSRHMETHCMREADLVVTLGAAMAREIAERGVGTDKIWIVPNAVDDAFLEPLPDARDLRARLGIPRDAVVIGTTSTFYRFEGIDTLLRAAAELRRRGAPVRLLLVGDGPYLPALRRLAGDLGLDRAVTFTGRVPFTEIRRYHAALDVFAVPRTGDRVCQLVTPLKPVEAMASALPVVASEVPALCELVEHEVTGTLTPPEQPRALADSLERLVDSPDRRRELGLAARARVARDRTWRTAAVRYRTAYATVSAGSRV